MRGQVFATTSGTSNYAALVQVRNPQLWFLRSGVWQRAAIPNGATGRLAGV